MSVNVFCASGCCRLLVYCGVSILKALEQITRHCHWQLHLLHFIVSSSYTAGRSASK